MTCTLVFMCEGDVGEAEFEVLGSVGEEGASGISVARWEGLGDASPPTRVKVLAMEARGENEVFGDCFGIGGGGGEEIDAGLCASGMGGRGSSSGVDLLFCGFVVADGGGGG